MRFPVVLTPDDNATLLVTCPSLPEVTSFGDDEEEALRHGRDAVLTALSARIGAREAVPLPHWTGGSGVTLPALVALKIELHNAMLAEDVRKAELGRRLGLHPAQVDRLLSLGHASRLDQLELALQAVGRRVEVSTHAA